MLFEQVLPALRAGKKVKRTGWFCSFSLKDLDDGAELNDLLANDWEIVPELKCVADYWVPDSAWGYVRMNPTAAEFARKQTYEIGKQPNRSVMIPNSEREENA
jgi:hypothetical protein